MAVEKVVLRGSERSAAAQTQTVGSPDPNSIVSVTVMLRRKNPNLPAPGTETITREEFASRFGADPADVPPIEEFATDNDLTVVEVDLARRSIVLSGTVANMSEAFATELQLFQGPVGIFRGRVGALYVPTHLSEIIHGVFGLDERPQARTHFRRMNAPRVTHAAATVSYTPIQVAELYDYPTTVTGTGQTIGIIELGGGFAVSDLQTYFSGLGINPIPSVIAVGVDGAQNTPVGDPNSADGEVLLDIEVVGAVAPRAKIVVYFAPNTDQGFLDAITTAVHDTVHAPSVISISWGGPESSWTAQALTNFDQAFQDAGTLGVSVCIAAGDNGSTDGVTDGKAHVDFPASSPNVLACGGTTLDSSKGVITKETVWNDGSGGGSTGGGVSETFPLPSYQASAKVPVSINSTHFKGRGVPDVAGDADPATGYKITVDGKASVFGGTSAVAPLWAALIALMNEQLGTPLGFLNTKIYTAGVEKSFHDITSGTNGGYKAGKGWDACTGWGSPNGTALLAALAGAGTTTKLKPGHKTIAPEKPTKRK